jgi:hypothetical protein
LPFDASDGIGLPSSGGIASGLSSMESPLDLHGISLPDEGLHDMALRAAVGVPATNPPQQRARVDGLRGIGLPSSGGIASSPAGLKSSMESPLGLHGVSLPDEGLHDMALRAAVGVPATSPPQQRARVDGLRGIRLPSSTWPPEGSVDRVRGSIMVYKSELFAFL